MKTPIVISVMSLLVLACSELPPPGGKSAYCYEVDVKLSQPLSQFKRDFRQELSFFTNTAPAWDGATLTIEEAYFAWNLDGPGKNQYDRYVESLTLPTALLGDVRISQRGPCLTPIPEKE